MEGELLPVSPITGTSLAMPYATSLIDAHSGSVSALSFPLGLSLLEAEEFLLKLHDLLL